MTARWVIQSNLGTTGDAEALRAACRRGGLATYSLLGIPMSGDLPPCMEAVPDDLPVVAFGAESFVAAVARSGRWSPGAFLFREGVDYVGYMRNYGDAMLNNDARVTTLGGLASEPLGEDALLFLRPVTDSKPFAGGVVRFGEVADWVRRLRGAGHDIDETLPVVVAQPCGITREWRTLVVAPPGKPPRVAAASLYKERGRARHLAGAPGEVVAFAEACAARWAPLPCFLLDVAETAGRLGVLELGCANASGLYAMDPGAVVSALTEAAVCLST